MRGVTGAALLALLAAGCGGTKPAETTEEKPAAERGVGDEAAAELKKAARVTGDKIAEVAEDMRQGGHGTLAEVQGIAQATGGELKAAGERLAGETQRVAKEVEANAERIADGHRPVPGPVTGSQARALVAAGAKLVDVRTPEEFGDGHLEGATNLPLDALPERLAELPDPAAPVVLYCRSGKRSAQAAALLRERGYTAVYELGPMSNW